MADYLTPIKDWVDWRLDYWPSKCYSTLWSQMIALGICLDHFFLIISGFQFLTSGLRKFQEALLRFLALLRIRQMTKGKEQYQMLSSSLRTSVLGVSGPQLLTDLLVLQSHDSPRPGQDPSNIWFFLTTCLHIKMMKISNTYYTRHCAKSFIQFI